MSTITDGYLAAVLSRIDDLLVSDGAEVEPRSGPEDETGLDRDPLDLVAEHVHSGGKRFRPRLALWGWAYAGGDATQPSADVVTLGAALELLHTFALVHDDVMDESGVRRGTPTVHVVMAREHAAVRGVGSSARFGESMAALVGDLAHAEAHHLAADLPADVRSSWHAMAVELVVGQAREVVGTAMARRSLEHARQVALLKSGRYSVQRPLELGARLAGATPARATELTTFGEHLGAAFAMRDDVLGVWGREELTGKPVGHDLRDGKATVLLALAQDHLPPSTRKLVDAAAHGPLSPAKVETLTSALERAGARERAEEHIEEQQALAVAALGEDAPETARQALTDMAERVTRRDS